ncbi:MAG: LolA family protein [Jatrophihabitantaceae bacterium]
MMLEGVLDDVSRPRSGSDSRQRRRRLLRWLLPIATLGVAVLVASGMLSANAKANLPSRSPAQLLAAISLPKQVGFSGTVVEKAAFGLPDLGGLAGSGLADGVGTGATPLSLLTGSHTIRVWYGSPTKQRIALLSTFGELDLFRNGDNLWQWNSDTRIALHRSLTTGIGLFQRPSDLPSLTPDQAAQRILAMMQPSTTVSIDRTAVVAGRPAYVLVLTPKQDGTRIRQARVSVDGATLVPLGVQVYARDTARPVLDASFTRFDPTAPSEDNFTWTPPAGVTVQSPPAQTDLLPGLTLPAGQPAVSTVGSGWTSVLKVTGLPSQAALARQSPQAAGLLGLLPAVRGAWGSGRLLQTSVLSALITDDGRAFVGAVDPAVLYAAAGSK